MMRRMMPQKRNNPITLKNEIKEAKKWFKELQRKFIKRLREARDTISDYGCRDLVIDILNEKLSGHLDSYVTVHRQEVIAAVENWWDKYRVTLIQIEINAGKIKKRLSDFVKELGYNGQ